MLDRSVVRSRLLQPAVAFAGAALLAAAPVAIAAPVEAELANGDVLRGELLASDDTSVTIQHPTLGPLTLERASLAELRVLEAEGEGEGEPAAEDAEDAVEEDAGPTWEGEVSLGLNGSRGSSDSDNLRAAASFQRLADDMETTLSFTYLLERDEGDNTENRFVASARNDWLVSDSKWRYFAQASFENDEFEGYEQRYRLGAGVGYDFINNDTTTLIGRAGLGVVHEAGDQDTTSLEGILGLDFTHQIDERSSFAASTEVFPDLTEGGDLRTVSSATYEIMLSDEQDLSLRLGIEHRFDAFSQDEKHEIDYFALVVYSF